MRPVLLLLGCLQLHAQRVETRQGNIIFVDKRGAIRQLTTAGHDSDPSISPDLSQVVFIRDAGPSSRGGPLGALEKTELWIADTAGRQPPRAVFQDNVNVTRQDGFKFEIGGFTNPRFSLDGRYCFFLAELAATTAGLCRLDLRTQTATLISNAMEYSLVTTGHWRGYIVANVRTYIPAPDGLGHHDYPFYLLDTDGKKIRQVGRAGEKLADVMDRASRLN